MSDVDHEAIHDDEVWRERAEQLHAGFSALAVRHGLEGQEHAWLAYRLDPAEEDGSHQETHRSHDVLVSMQRHAGIENRKIRVISNEQYSFKGPTLWRINGLSVPRDGARQILVRDTVLTPSGFCWYELGLINATDDPDLKRTHAPFFKIADGKLRYRANMRPFPGTHCEFLESEETRTGLREKAYPLGSIKRAAERLNNLDAGIDAYDEVKDLVPVHTSLG